MIKELWRRRWWFIIPFLVTLFILLELYLSRPPWKDIDRLHDCGGYCDTLAPAPLFHTGNHNLTQDDGHAFAALTEPARRYNHMERPPILFAYNYYEYAEQLREHGLNTFSMSMGLSGTHVRGTLDDLPFPDVSLAAVILLQKMPYSGLFQACEVLCVHGILLIQPENMPHLGEILLVGLGFRKTSMSWHAHQIYHKREHKAFASDLSGFKQFSQKKVKSPYLYHKSLKMSA